MCYYNGLLLFAVYHDCDPLTTKLAKAKDQLMPLLVMELLKNIPGLPGLFIAGVFSAALSSLSTSLNSMAAVVLEDFYKPFSKSPISERKSAIIMRSTVAISGIISVALVYVVQHMGSVVQLTIAFASICFAPMLGIFLIGMFLPWIGKKATLYSAVLGCIGMAVFVAKVQTEVSQGNIKFPTKPVSVEGCQYEFTKINRTSLIEEYPEDMEKTIFHISFLYYNVLGTFFVVICSALLSFFFGFNDASEVDTKLLAPCLQNYFTNAKITKQDKRDEYQKVPIDIINDRENL